MRRIAYTCCIFVLSLSTTSIYSQDSLETKLKILDLMIEDNIENARTEYAKLTYSSHNPEIKNKAVALLIDARQLYEIQALKILAFEKYETNEVVEALGLLCEASILGDLGAMRDLYLLPKIMHIQNKQVEKSCNLATSKMKLSTGNFSTNNLKLSQVRSKLNTFEYKRNFLNMGYLAYLNYVLSRTDMFTLKGYQEFIELNTKGNVKKLKRSQRETRERNEILTANWERRTHLDRKANRKAGAEDVLTHLTARDMLLINEELQLKLVEVNKLRAPDKKISSQELMDLIKEYK